MTDKGHAEPLGATLVPGGANVAVAAPAATAVDVCIFDTEGREVARHRLAGRTGDVRHGHIPGLAAGARYGLRAEGPWDPAQGLRCNPAKLLLDPYARRLDRAFALHPSLFDTGAAPDPADSAPHMPKALLEPALYPQEPRPRSGPEVIYELHVRGFTRLHPDIPERMRGTFAGLGHPAAIAHLQRLGVTLVELLPVAAWVDERHLPPLWLSNYWGYNPVGWLAPDPRLAPGGMAEVRAAVSALANAGIGTILDVVFNHSGEGDALGPTLSLRGLDEGTYYRRAGGALVNDAGCGNTLALDRPWPLRLAMDAMRHWAEQAGIAGFRLDLATTMGRRTAGFDTDAPLLQAMRQDPLLRQLRIIAEPWDLGAEGYRLGGFPPGWGEWNDRFRDSVRRFWRGDAGMVGELATRLAGSADIFSATGRPLTDSVNFVTAHDGFTLADLVSHERRHNEANGEANRDGTDNNLSWNQGIEGPSDDPAITARRQGDVRALLATLLTARGTPMLAMGDEAGRSQGGNNNAYAQDNALSWLDWAGADQGLVDFTARLVAARRGHPALLADAVLTGGPVDASGISDVDWQRPDGGPVDWDAPGTQSLVAVLYAGGARALLALNAGDVAQPLRLPPPRPGHAWQVLADSAAPERKGPCPPDGLLAARAVLLLDEAPASRRRPGDTADAPLAELAEAAGIDTLWHDISGTAHQVPRETLTALLAALGMPGAQLADARDSRQRLAMPPALPPTVTVQADAPGLLTLGPPLSAAAAPFALVILREDGERMTLRVWPEDGCALPGRLPDGRLTLRRRISLPPLPAGQHVIFAEHRPELLGHVIAAPSAAFLPDALAEGGRGFAITAQAYALRRRDDQGIGDFTALAELAAAADAAGALLLGLSPPHALPPVDRGRASPYQPSDRRFLEPALIDVAHLPFLADAPGVRLMLAANAGVFAALAAGEAVDYAAVWAAKKAVLGAAWGALRPGHPARSKFAAFRAAGGTALERFAAFTALAEYLGHSEVSRFPLGLQRGDAPGLDVFAATEADRIGEVICRQWLADKQLGLAAKAGAGLYRDLAVGAAPDGAEVWSAPDAFLDGFSVGAPPDPLGPEGQVWGLPPPNPWHGIGSGEARFAALLDANMRHAAALRIDHVMGLQRLFVVPHGATGAEGAYLRYPREALLGRLTLASQRHRCLVIGEDLGTVPEGLPDRLAEAKVLSYRVLWFARDAAGFGPVAAWPAAAAACVSTHDLPPLAGWWDATDIAERETLGLLDAAGATAARAGRAAEKAALLSAIGAPPDAAYDPVLAAGIHHFVAASPPGLMLVQAEDLAGERVGVNLPGTDRERPNWRHRMAVPAAELLATPLAEVLLAAVRAGRG